MRLIDADALLKALKANCDTLCNDKNTNWCEHCCPKNDFEDLIDNAPTIEPCYQTTSCLDCKMYDKENHHCPRFCEVIRELVKETGNDTEKIAR